MTYRIVDTDNFGGDYPDERFVMDASGSPAEFQTKDGARKLVDEMNDGSGTYAPRYYKVVKMPYELVAGFEP